VYRAALSNRTGQAKFVNLDMEEYRDLHLTVDVFQQLLDEDEFRDLSAGIVLQAYLPDSWAVQQLLVEWARERVANGGAPIKIRLVKGANLAMEQVEAALRGWPQAPYHNKLDVDANFKRMLEFGTRPEHARVARLGVASHNLFDIAYAMLLRQLRGVNDLVEFEMLEGMANGQALEVSTRTGGVVLYTPCVLDKEFEAAVAYLVRRLDENTAPGSFLGALFGLKTGSPEWQVQSDAFLAACRRAADPALPCTPNRRQNRQTETHAPVEGDRAFRNVPDTDLSIPANREWAEAIVHLWSQRAVDPIPLEVGGQRL
jgi:RHH-type proline utilization regulon transcriptional repressor/proline dehydrogenase/delta 1-pyrroline-5-carboxylate dehydrogenase